MPYLTINIVNRETPVFNPKTGNVELSFAGHMWYTIQQDTNSIPTSYGFAPLKEGTFDGPGGVNPHGSDSANYVINPSDGDYTSQKIYITQQEYDKLNRFGKNPFSDEFKFDSKYNGLYNSCIDFTWAALAKAGLTPTINGKFFQGDVIPVTSSPIRFDLIHKKVKPFPQAFYY